MPDSTETQRQFESFKKKVKEMLECQQAYFKTKDFQLLKKSKAMEKEVRDIITPKQSSQATIDWLGQ
jgi:hypothetical protein